MPGPVFEAAPRLEELAQGDLLESIEFFHPKKGSYKDTVWLSGMVLSHSCDFTKFRADEKKGRANLDRFPLLVAPVIDESQIPDAGTVGHAKRDRVPRYFFLPGEDPLSNEAHFVDFWFMQPVSVFELLNVQRLGSLSDEWQKRLQIALDRFFSWEDRKQPLEAR